MTDSSEIGRFGTLRLLKHHHPDTTIAFFPIDDEQVTFGRGRQCSIRLYYDYVSELHCTLHISEERKAFLTVHGTNGLLVDGCEIVPAKTPGANPPMVPLVNGSEIEIHKKRFRFEYPPKEIRAALLSTPRHAKSRRSLRMSMIRSAQVYTPGANGDDRPPSTPRRGSIRDNADWEALRSPIRVPSADNSTEEIDLLDGSGEDATVVDEDTDLIILEHVDEQAKTVPVSPSKQTGTIPSRSVAFSLAPSSSTPPPPGTIPVPKSAHPIRVSSPHTPSRRRKSAPSLHRAVVLRSAQRLLIQRESRRLFEMDENEEEEREVIAAVSPERELGPFELSNESDEYNGGEDEDEDDEDEDGEGDGNNYDYDDEDKDENDYRHKGTPFNSSSVPSTTPKPTSIFKAGFDAVKKLAFDRVMPENVPLPEDEQDEEKSDDNQMDEDYEQTPVRRNLGPFMTPQAWASKRAQRIPVDVKARASVGGPNFFQRVFGGAQRVRVVPPWKLEDIEMPEPRKETTEGTEVKRKNRITEEERQAINARRKSALQMSTALPTFEPHCNPTPSRRLSDDYTPGVDANEDTETMLNKMKQKVDSVRRKSEVRRIRFSIASPQKKPEFSLLATPKAERSPFVARSIVDGTPSQKESAGQKGYHLPSSEDNISDDEEHGDSDVEKTAKGQIALAQTPVRIAPTHGSLTPRFDGVREIFRQTRLEPKTPSFAGIKAMYQRPGTPPKTPSFRGIKEMYKIDPDSILATPHMDLGEICDEDGEVENDENENLEEGSGPQESDDSLTPNDDGKTDESEHDSHLTAARDDRTTRTSKRLVDVPCDVSADEMDDQVEHARPTRRSTKRCSKKTTVSVIQEAEDDEDAVQPIASRDTRQKTHIQPNPAAHPAARGLIIHKTRRTRRPVNTDESDDEPVLDSVPERTTNPRRRARSKDVHTEEEETALHPVEDLAIPKTRSGRRVAKTAQPVLAQETASAPAKTTRRVKTETASSDMEGLRVASKPSRQKRGGIKTTTKENDHEKHQDSSESIDGPSKSDAENLSPAGTGRGRAPPKRAAGKNTLAADKKTGDGRPAATTTTTVLVKTPAPRGRRTPASAPVAASDAPAKRTRSRK